MFTLTLCSSNLILGIAAGYDTRTFPSPSQADNSYLDCMNRFAEKERVPVSSPLSLLPVHSYLSR